MIEAIIITLFILPDLIYNPDQAKYGRDLFGVIAALAKPLMFRTQSPSSRGMDEEPLWIGAVGHCLG